MPDKREERHLQAVTDDERTMVRTQVRIDQADYLLAQGEDIDHLKARIEEAAQTAGRFVSFVVVGNRSVSVLVSSTSRVVVSVETVLFDARDTGDEEYPFGGLFDGF